LNQATAKAYNITFKGVKHSYNNVFL